MKKTLGFILFLITVLLSIGIFCACRQQTAPEYFYLSYTASEGGILQGGYHQRIKPNEDGESVTAVANVGYYFVKWSDGVTTSTRLDSNVNSNITVSAEFAEITDGVKITYNTRGVGGSGYISGINEQVVQRGTDGWKVTAHISDNMQEDIAFIGWSDGVTTATRQEREVAENIEVTAIFGIISKYTAGEHGRIDGVLNQIVEYGNYASPVIAVPERGYTFVGWSDGVLIAKREDLVISKIDVTANFEWRDTDYFRYNYNFATSNYSEKALKLTRGQVNESVAVVPVRDHFNFNGWYFDANFNERVTDETGRIEIGEDIFNISSRDLYAKWTVKEEDVVKYKILIVNVTAIDAKLLGNDGAMVNLHYRMSEEERNICNDITEQFGSYLNGMLDGLVKFEVDTYFTSQPIGEESFESLKYTVSGPNDVDYCVYADRVPELNQSGILDNYRSVLTAFSLNNDNRLLSVSSGGLSRSKYASIWFDKLNFNNAEQLNDSVYTYIHEFTHTAAMSIPTYNYHDALGVGMLDEAYNRTRLYLINQCPINAEKNVFVGIPYTYWSNEIFQVSLKCEADDHIGGNGGYISESGSDLWYERNYLSIDGVSIQQVPKGSRTTTLQVFNYKGYKFVGWSDGSKDEVRIITNVQEDITLTAYFKKLEYTTNIAVQEGGMVKSKYAYRDDDWRSGNTSYTMKIYNEVIQLTAIAEDGYEFIGWSDGESNATRYFSIDALTVDYYDKYQICNLIAMFKKNN